jgi:hypothetical protein
VVLSVRVVFFWAGSGGRTHSTTGRRSWKVVEVLLLYQMELPHGWSTFFGSGVWNHIGACWSFVWFFGREWYSDWMGSLHHLNGLGRWWRSFSCDQMEHRIWSHLSTWVRSGNAVGRCVLAALVFFWAGSGGTSHQERSWKVVEVILWNFTSWFGQPFHLRLESLEPYWCLLEHFVWFLCNGVLLGWIWW